MPKYSPCEGAASPTGTSHGGHDLEPAAPRSATPACPAHSAWRTRCQAFAREDITTKSLSRSRASALRHMAEQVHAVGEVEVLHFGSAGRGAPARHRISQWRSGRRSRAGACGVNQRYVDPSRARARRRLTTRMPAGAEPATIPNDGSRAAHLLLSMPSVARHDLAGGNPAATSVERTADETATRHPPGAACSGAQGEHDSRVATMRGADPAAREAARPDASVTAWLLCA